MGRQRSSHCTMRWHFRNTSRYSKPPRPVACPCMWSQKLINQHFEAAVQEDIELALSLSALLALMWDSGEVK